MAGDERRPRDSSPSSVAGIQATSADVGVGDEREPEQRAATRLAAPGRRRRRARRRRPSSATASAADRRPSVTSATSSCRSAPLGAIPAAGPSASASRSANVRNSRKSNSRLTSSGFGSTPASSKSTASSGASRRSTISSRFLRARSSCSASDARGASASAVSTLAKMPSSPPYVVDQLGGRLLADARARRAGCRWCRRAAPRTAGTAPACTPVFSTMPASS